MEIAKLVATYIADTTNFEQGNERVQKGLKGTADDADRAAQKTDKLAATMNKAGDALNKAGLALSSIVQPQLPDFSIAPKVDGGATSAALATGIAQTSNIAVKASEGLANSAVSAVYKIFGGPEAKTFYSLGLQAGKQLAAGMKDGKIGVVNAKEQAAGMAGVKLPESDGKGKTPATPKPNTTDKVTLKGTNTAIADGNDKKEIRFAQRIQEAMDNVKKSIRTTGEYLTQTFIDLPMSIGNIFASAVQNWDGTFKGFFKSIGQGFAQLMQQIAAELIRILVIETMLKIVRGIMGGSTPAPSGTEGATAVHEMGHALPHASGGLISGPGTETSDSIPAWLSNGEFVMSAKAVSKFGQGFMHTLNNLEMPKFALGGPVLAGAGGFNSGEMFVPSGRMLNQDNSRKNVSNKSTVNNINVNVPRDNPLSTPKSRRQAAESMLGSLRRYSK